MDRGILLYYKWTVCSRGHGAGRARRCYQRKKFVTMCPWSWNLWPLFPWFINLKYIYIHTNKSVWAKSESKTSADIWKIEWHADYSGLHLVEIMEKLWHNEHRRRISQKHNREHTPKDIHCRMNHRFLGKCRRGSAHSPASMWGLPIIRGSDLNVTYIIAFFSPCRGSLVEHRKSTEKQKASTVLRLVRVNAVILQSHCFYGVSVSERFAPGPPTHMKTRL